MTGLHSYRGLHSSREPLLFLSRIILRCALMVYTLNSFKGLRSLHQERQTKERTDTTVDIVDFEIKLVRFFFVL